MLYNSQCVKLPLNPLYNITAHISLYLMFSGLYIKYYYTITHRWKNVCYHKETQNSFGSFGCKGVIMWDYLHPSIHPLRSPHTSTEIYSILYLRLYVKEEEVNIN